MSERPRRRAPSGSTPVAAPAPGPRLSRPAAVPDYLKETAYIDILESGVVRLTRNNERAQKRFYWTAGILLLPWILSLLGLVPALVGVLGGKVGKMGGRVRGKLGRYGGKVGHKMADEIEDLTGLDLYGYKERVGEWYESEFGGLRDGVKGHAPRWGPALEASKGFGDPRSPYANLILSSFNFVFGNPWDILGIPKSSELHPLNEKYIGAILTSESGDPLALPSNYREPDLTPAQQAFVYSKAKKLSEPWENDEACGIAHGWFGLPVKGEGKYLNDVCGLATGFFKRAVEEICSGEKRGKRARAIQKEARGEETV